MTHVQFTDINKLRYTVRNMGCWRMGNDDPSKQLHTNAGNTAMSCSSVVWFQFCGISVARHNPGCLSLRH